jgi:hypothetical protein
VADVQLSAALVLDRLGHLELRLKQAGAVVDAGGIRLSILEVLRMVEEAKPKSAPAEISPLMLHL